MKVNEQLLVELHRLATETNTQRASLESLTPADAIQFMVADYLTILPIVSDLSKEIESVIYLCEGAIRNHHSVVYVGAGTSGRLGVLDASECPPTFGVSPTVFRGIIAGGDSALRRSIEGAEDNITQAIQDYQNEAVQKNDVLIGITASSRTPYVISMLQHHHSQGGKTVLLVCNLKEKVDYPMVDVLLSAPIGNEPVTGSTRLKSGTITKIILNMISTLTMVRLGKVYKNYMVDLMATNEKLKARTVKILCELTGCSTEVATSRLVEAKLSLKHAIVMQTLSVSRENADDLLLKHHGDLQSIL